MAWRAAEGRLDLTRLALRWGKLDVVANAQLQLDAQLQPAGEGTVQAVGLPETFDALAAAGMMPAGTARAARAVAALMARPPDGEVELPVTLAERTLSVARFPVARLPEMVWPPAPAGARVTP
jgi:hypothetical protein